LKNKTNKSAQKQKIDVYSRFSEDNIEFVSREDEREAILHVLHSHEEKFFTSEKGWYDGCS
jgi:hypothetical protein